jgi:hypothetical protein
MTGSARPDLDICACGDSRRDHPDDGACVICRAFPAPWGGCVRFRFSHPASALEVAERVDEYDAALAALDAHERGATTAE